MEPEEKKTNDKFKCCMPEMDKQKMAEMMAKCGEDADGAGSCFSMMAKCMKKCRWFPLIPLTVGILFFVAGYYLNAEIVRLLWLILSGLIILKGVLCFIMISVISRK